MPKLNLTFDTTFFTVHYFTEASDVQKKTREIIRISRLQGNRGVVPTIVLSEFYAQAAKRAGASEAERRFDEILNSGLDVVDLDPRISKRAGIIRHKYQEKIPWGDCLVAATSFETSSEYVLSEDPEFKSIKEIKCRNLSSLNV